MVEMGESELNIKTILTMAVLIMANIGYSKDPIVLYTDQSQLEKLQPPSQIERINVSGHEGVLKQQARGIPLSVKHPALYDTETKTLIEVVDMDWMTARSTLRNTILNDPITSNKIIKVEEANTELNKTSIDAGGTNAVHAAKQISERSKNANSIPALREELSKMAEMVAAMQKLIEAKEYLKNE